MAEPTDNRAIVAETVKLRAERASLLGFKSFADYRLDDQMAKTPANARKLLDEVWGSARARAGREKDELQKLVAAEGGNFALAQWDWRYYAEKLRKARYDLDEASVKPYLALDNMIAAAFETATRLFGLTFKPAALPLYHPDARAWEVRDKDGKEVALFIGDYFSRTSKHSGAWMTSLRDQEKLRGNIRPIILNVCNFTKPAPGEPALLSFDDARTLFHEFGHALHGMLSDVTYPLLAGTAVSSDFVELPSQLYEHWLETPEILKKYARHYKSGEPMPEALLDKVLKTRTFNQGFATVEYTACALVDLDFHSLSEPGDARRHRAGKAGARPHPYAGRDRDAPPHPALPAPVLGRRLCGGLLLLHVVGGARRRRLRRLQGGGRPFRPGHGEAAARLHLFGRQSARPGGGL